MYCSLRVECYMVIIVVSGLSDIGLQVHYSESQHEMKLFVVQ